MFDKIIIANRGEIALRVLRACKELDISTVAIHSTADSEAMHVRLADESVCIGPPPSSESYLNKAAIISAAMVTGSDAIHPGYGFLSENADFAQMVEEHKIKFIGPSAEHIRLMGDKIQAKEIVKSLGIPVIPGSDGAIQNSHEVIKIAKKIGYPVLIKASAGGGGRGMKVAESEDNIIEAYATASSEAKSAFGNGTVYIEKFLMNPRHIEIQIISDSYGNVLHLGERDCSIQRKHQKIIEECPSPIINKSDRDKIGNIVCKAIKKFGYENVGTIEFLYENGDFFFIEMNTRLQVEHPVTEMTTGIDLVKEQIKIAAGQKICFTQEDIVISGHAIECRINAEDPSTFLPSPGKVETYHVPGGPGIRIDSGLFSGSEVPPFYDSLISKLIVHGKNRDDCILRLRRAINEYVIGNIKTSIPLHEKILKSEDFISGKYNIRWLEEFVKNKL